MNQTDIKPAHREIVLRLFRERQTLAAICKETGLSADLVRALVHESLRKAPTPTETEIK